MNFERSVEYYPCIKDFVEGASEPFKIRILDCDGCL